MTTRVYELNGGAWQEAGAFDLMDVALKQYGRNFTGKLKNERTDAYSWKAKLKDKTKGSLDLQGYLDREDVKERYNCGGRPLLAYCSNPRDSYSWKVLVRIDY